jgi:hypothetical protein
MGKLRIDMKENKIYYLVSWNDDRRSSYDWVSIEEIQKNPDKYSDSRCAIYQKVDIEQLLKNENN